MYALSDSARDVSRRIVRGINHGTAAFSVSAMDCHGQGLSFKWLSTDFQMVFNWFREEAHDLLSKRKALRMFRYSALGVSEEPKSQRSCGRTSLTQRQQPKGLKECVFRGT